MKSELPPANRNRNRERIVGCASPANPEERRVLVGGDPQPERHLLTVLFGRDACVVEAVEPLLRIAVLETEGEPLRLGVAVKWKAASG